MLSDYLCYNAAYTKDIFLCVHTDISAMTVCKSTVQMSKIYLANSLCWYHLFKFVSEKLKLYLAKVYKETTFVVLLCKRIQHSKVIPMPLHGYLHHETLAFFTAFLRYMSYYEIYPCKVFNRVVISVCIVYSHH